MVFDEKFIASVEENPFIGIVEACKKTFVEIEKVQDLEGWNEDQHELLWETCSFISLIIEIHKMQFDKSLPIATGDISKNCSALYSYLQSVNEHFETQYTLLKIDSFKSRYESMFKSSFAYEFSQGDLDRIQVLINELRSHITESKSLEADHKQRLLKKLEKLQNEVHKRMSDLDKFWGLIGDAGVVLGKLGKDAKPIVDRVREVGEIVWKTQIRSEELPSSTPVPILGKDEEI